MVTAQQLLWLLILDAYPLHMHIMAMAPTQYD